MPTELPGFYWDEIRNRYFPIASQPKDPVTTDHTSSAPTKSSETPEPKPTPKYSPLHTHSIRMTSTSYTKQMREAQYVCNCINNHLLNNSQ